MFKKPAIIVTGLLLIAGLYLFNKSDPGCSRVFINPSAWQRYPMKDRIYYLVKGKESFKLGYKFIDPSSGPNAEFSHPGFSPRFVGSNDHLYLSYRREKKSSDDEVLVKIEGSDITHVLDLGKSWVGTIGSFDGADLIVTHERSDESRAFDKTMLFTSKDNWQTHDSVELDVSIGSTVVAGDKVHVFGRNTADPSTHIYSYNMATNELDYSNYSFTLYPLPDIEESDDVIAGYRINRQSYQFMRFVGGSMETPKLVAESDVGNVLGAHSYGELFAYSYLNQHDSDAIGEDLKLVISKNGGRTWSSTRALSDYHDVSFYKDQYFVWMSNFWKLQVCGF